LPWSGSDVIHHIRLSKLSIKSSHWTISTSNAIFHLSSGIFSNGRCNDYGGRPGALLHRAGFGLTHQSYAFWFGDCDGQDLSWPIIPTGCACTLKIVRLAAHVYLYCMESLEGLRAEPQWNLSRILNILSTVGIVNGLRRPAAGHHCLICRPVSPPALRSCPAYCGDAGSGHSGSHHEPGPIGPAHGLDRGFSPL
jgi:hypothetical protein